MRTLIRTLRGQRGAETLEWILIGGIIVLVGIAVYGPNSALKTALTTTVTSVGASIKNAVK
jgi:Flp pilus assembly pilin Flp